MACPPVDNPQKAVEKYRVGKKPAALKGTMDRNAKYRRFLSRDSIPIDAVRIRIIEEDTRVVAEVKWPENELTDKGDYFYATHIPLSFERALDVKENYDFSEIIIVIDDDRMWKSEWGELVTSS
jgi:hypothetical protein